MINRDDIPETFGNVLRFGFFSPIGLYGEGLAEFLGLDLYVLNAILDDEKEIGDKEDEALCKAFNKNKGFFLDLQKECKLRTGTGETKEEEEILDLT